MSSRARGAIFGIALAAAGGAIALALLRDAGPAPVLRSLATPPAVPPQAPPAPVPAGIGTGGVASRPVATLPAAAVATRTVARPPSPVANRLGGRALHARDLESRVRKLFDPRSDWNEHSLRLCLELGFESALEHVLADEELLRRHAAGLLELFPGDPALATRVRAALRGLRPGAATDALLARLGDPAAIESCLRRAIDARLPAQGFFGRPFASRDEALAFLEKHKDDPPGEVVLAGIEESSGKARPEAYARLAALASTDRSRPVIEAWARAHADDDEAVTARPLTWLSIVVGLARAGSEDAVSALVEAAVRPPFRRVQTRGSATDLTTTQEDPLATVLRVLRAAVALEDLGYPQQELLDCFRQQSVREGPYLDEACAKAQEKLAADWERTGRTTTIYDSARRRRAFWHTSPR